jgi:hypothetical protein
MLAIAIKKKVHLEWDLIKLYNWITVLLVTIMVLTLMPSWESSSSESSITAKRIEELKPSLCRWGYSSVNDMFYRTEKYSCQ